jgi:lysozyme
MKLGAAGTKLMHEFEGLSLKAYPDPATRGEPYTIGYGHTAMAGLPKVKMGDVITQKQADEIFARDLGKYEDAVMIGITHQPTQNQFDAMVSLCYNIGPGNFNKSSVRRLFNAKDYKGAARAFLSWNKAAGKVMKGLTRRREAERKLFETEIA